MKYCLSQETGYYLRMRAQYHILCTLFCITFLLSFSAMAQDTNTPEVKKDSPAKKSTPSSQTEKISTKKEDPTQPKQDEPSSATPSAVDKLSDTAPIQDDPAVEAPATEAKQAESQPTPEEPTSETPGDGEQTVVINESNLPDAKAPKEKLPYEKGDMEADLSVALAGTGNDFYFGVAGSWGYYVANRFALGMTIQYTHIFSDSKYDYKPPESLMFLPFLKFAITRSKSVSPYVFVTGGYEGRWTHNAKEGFLSSPNAWLIGAGGGVHVGITKNLAINIKLLGAHKWYSDTQVYRYKDSDLYHKDNTDETTGGTYKCEQDGGCNTQERFDKDPLVTLTRKEKRESGETVEETYYCYDLASCEEVYDKKDKKSEWLFPLITIGITFFF